MAEQRVVLVSTDMRRPRLGEFLGLDESVGITSVVLGRATLDEALQPVAGVPGLSFLGCGTQPPNPAELLGSRTAADIFTQLHERFDLVLVDSPPILPVADPIILSKLVDMTLLVVSTGQTKKRQLERAYEQLRQARVERIGIILNKMTKESNYSYGYGAGYTSDYRPGSSKDAPSPNGSRSVKTSESPAGETH
jgi:capsular exopolysaccharide synthesis family protein